VNYDPQRDITPVSLGIRFPYLLVVHPSLPVKSVKELIALAKAHPGKITYASSGTGLSNHLAGEMFKDMAGIDIVHIPYKGGGPVLAEMMGGQVTMTFGTVLQTLPQVRAGRLRALAVSSAKRVSFAADLPTISETGLPGFEALGWYSIAVAAATPSPVVTKLNQEVVRILTQPAVRERLLALGTEPNPSTVEEAREFYASELARWSKVVIRAGLKGTE
jgi:tripartite-type tricarboxylate transporter receptor subunit TctC